MKVITLDLIRELAREKRKIYPNLSSGRILQEITKENPDIGPLVTDLIKQKRRINPNLSPGMAFAELTEKNPHIMLRIKNLIREKRGENPNLSPGMAFREVIEENPELVEMIDKDIQAALDPELRASLLSKLVELKLKEKKDLYYSEAFSEVQKENPGLTFLYQTDLTKKR